MKPREQCAPKRWSAGVPYWVLLASITATFIAAYQSQIISRAREQTRFDQAVEHAVASIQGELRAYLTLLEPV
jgi:CHASE1-domain containing sensor protein